MDHCGRFACSMNALFGSTPCLSVLLVSEMRLASLIRLVFVLGSGAVVAMVIGARLWILICRSLLGAWMVSVIVVFGACLCVFVRFFCVIWYVVCLMAAGGVLLFSSIWVVICMLVVRDFSTRVARSVSVGWGGCVRFSLLSSCRMLMTLCSFLSVVFVLWWMMSVVLVIFLVGVLG